MNAPPMARNRGEWESGSSRFNRAAAQRSSAAVHLKASAPQQEDEGEYHQPGEHQAGPVCARVDAHVLDLGREVAGETQPAAARIERRESDAPHRWLLPDEHALDRLVARVVD